MAEGNHNPFQNLRDPFFRPQFFQDIVMGAANPGGIIVDNGNFDDGPNPGGIIADIRNFDLRDNPDADDSASEGEIRDFDPEEYMSSDDDGISVVSSSSNLPSLDEEGVEPMDVDGIGGELNEWDNLPDRFAVNRSNLMSPRIRVLLDNPNLHQLPMNSVHRDANWLEPDDAARIARERQAYRVLDFKSYDYKMHNNHTWPPLASNGSYVPLQFSGTFFGILFGLMTYTTLLPFLASHRVHPVFRRQFRTHIVNGKRSPAPLKELCARAVLIRDDFFSKIDSTVGALFDDDAQHSLLMAHRRIIPGEAPLLRIMSTDVMRCIRHMRTLLRLNDNESYVFRMEDIHLLFFFARRLGAILSSQSYERFVYVNVRLEITAVHAMESIINLPFESHIVSDILMLTVAGHQYLVNIVYSLLAWSFEMFTKGVQIGFLKKEEFDMSGLGASNHGPTPYVRVESDAALIYHYFGPEAFYPCPVGPVEDKYVEKLLEAQKREEVEETRFGPVIPGGLAPSTIPKF